MKKSFLTWMTWIVVVIAIIGGMVALVLWDKNRPKPGEAVADQGRKHVTAAQSEDFEHNSNPPTSGPHLAQVPPFGIYEVEISKGYQIHLLEHGGILIQYKTSDQAAIDQLRALVRDLTKTNPRIVLAPNASLEHEIALTAWTHLEQLDSLDETKIEEFFQAYVNQGPEKVTPSVDMTSLPEDAPTPLEIFQ